jgi:hypothetical protein
MTTPRIQTRRVLTIVCDDTDSAEALTHVISMAQDNPWAPLPPGAPRGTKQERYPDEKVDTWIVKALRDHASRMHLVGSAIIPNVEAS